MAVLEYYMQSVGEKQAGHKFRKKQSCIGDVPVFEHTFKFKVLRYFFAIQYVVLISIYYTT